MKYSPRPYQEPCLDFLEKTKRAGLFLFMGGGKTSSVLITLSRLDLVEEVFPVLIVAPLRVARTTWHTEVAKWDELRGLRVSCVVGSAEEREAALATPADVYTLNYENLPWLYAKKHRPAFKTIVTDEHSRTKNFRGSVQTHWKTGKKFLRCDSGVRTEALARMAFGVNRFIALTGTPAANGLQNLWAETWFLDQGQRLGRTYGDFEQRWFGPHPSGYGVIPFPHSQAEIQDRIKDICLTVSASDWLDLQKPINVRVTVDLPPRAREAYRKMEREMFLEISGHEIEAANAASKTMKCLQLCNGAIYLTEDRKEWEVLHDGKIEALESIVEEAEGMPVLVAYHFKSDLDRLKRAFPKGRHLNTKKDEDDFKAGKVPILFAHPASAGHGIDGFQHVTNIVVFFGHWWDLELRDQFIERIGPVRQYQAGLTRPVTIYDIVTERTVDELVLERHTTKRRVQDILLDALNRSKAQLSNT